MSLTRGLTFETLQYMYFSCGERVNTVDENVKIDLIYYRCLKILCVGDISFTKDFPILILTIHIHLMFKYYLL